MEEENAMLEEDDRSRFVVCCNRPEADAQWESSEEEWVGKASMAKRHRFLTTTDLRWEWFNVLTFGLDGGLADGTTAADLAPHLSVTAKDAGPLSVSLSRPSAGVLQIEGAFEPDRQYVVAVAAADGVRDGFGLPLQTSSTTFRTAALPQFFPQGGTQYGGAVTARGPDH